MLPGVTVEASSPVLIEKVRSAVADGAGQYRIVNLRAGTYTVTFTLPGFGSVKREGIELTGAFVATVNGEMRVGTLEETVTVTGETPIVDVQSVRLQTVMNNDMISALPTSRAYNSLMTLMPNAVAAGGAASDAQTVPGMVVFGGAGGRGNEGRLQLDGLSVGSAFNGAGVSAYIPDIGNAAEISMVSSGGLGEAEVGGPTMNIVPKEGGNTIAGSFYAAATSEGMVGSNYSQSLMDRGLTTPGELQQLWDLNLGIGGPIVRDRLWYFAGVRDEGSHRSVPGMFANANAGDPNKWTYVADTSRPAVHAASYFNLSLRLTVQATPRNKFNVFWDEQAPCEGGATPEVASDVSTCRSSGDGEYFAGGTAAPTPRASATLAPETAAYRQFGQRVRQVKWTSPVTNRVLLESSGGAYWSRYGGIPMPGSSTTDLIRVVEQCAGAGCLANGNIPGLTYRSGNWSSNINMSVNWAAAATYVLGAQSLKFGYQGAFLYQQNNALTNSQYLQYRYEQRRAGSDDHDDRQLFVRRARPRRLLLRAGSVDARPDDAAGGAAVRPRVELFPGGAGRPRPVLPESGRLPAHRGRHGLSRPHATRRHRVRCLRQRENGHQGECGPVSRSRPERRPLHRLETGRTPGDHDDQGLDGYGQGLRGRLRLVESRAAGSAEQERRFLRPECQPGIWHAEL